MDEFDREKLSNQLLRNYMEEFDKAEEEAQKRSFLSRIFMPLTLSVITVFVIVGWYYDKFAVSNMNNTDVPIVKASAKPVRVRPDNPGGMQIENTDKLVYNTIANAPIQEEKTIKDIRIIPGPEALISRNQMKKSGDQVDQILSDLSNNTPVDPEASNVAQSDTPQLKASLSQTSHSFTQPLDTTGGSEFNALLQEQAKMIKDLKDELAKKDAQVQENQKKFAALEARLDRFSTASNVPSPMNMEQETVLFGRPAASKAPTLEKGNVFDSLVSEIKRDVRPLTADDVHKIPKPLPKMALLKEGIPALNKKVSGPMIQLGAYRTESEVPENWQRIRGSHSTLLSGLNYLSERADLGNRGTFYRLRVGPFKSANSARKLCKKLRDANQECLFVNR